VVAAGGAPTVSTSASHDAAAPPATSTALCATPWKPIHLDLPALKHEGNLPDKPTTTGQWTWITLWAAWCHPCKEELPMLVEWSQQLDLQLLPLSLDDDERQLQGFLDAAGAPITTSYWMVESDARTHFLSGVGMPDPPTLPEQLLVDPRGMIQCVVTGAVQPGDLARVKTLLASQSP
jgi:thiol-disulfide isomerase/thioredoxin